MPPPHFDVAVVGGGILGLATARQLLLGTAQSVALLEAEPALAQHQTGRNSGVVHAGIYYKPGSLKARLCLDGMQKSYKYFDQKGIPYRKVGKLIVALRDSDRPQLQHLYQNALTNAVPDVAYLDSPEQIRRVEPECAGVAAIHSPNTGIVDWGLVANHFGDDIRDMGGSIFLNSKVSRISYDGQRKVSLFTQAAQSDRTAEPTVTAERVITCAGAQSDRVAGLMGGAKHPQIVPVRGEYLRVTNERIASRIHGNIYPLPDSGSGSPFLGIHFTRTMNDEVIVGPNAVLAFARDGYSPTDVRLADVAQLATNAAFWKLCWTHGRYGLKELYHSIFVSAAAQAAREYVPALSVTDFDRRGADRSGIRGQAVSSDGKLVDDFVFESAGGGRVLHTRNAPSPGATSSLAISEMIVDQSNAISRSI